MFKKHQRHEKRIEPIKGSPFEWKGYIVDFILMFLAVYLGFQAENYRQEREEKKLEKIYIGNILRDLNKDKDQVRDVLNDTIIIAGVDSLLRILYCPTIDSMNIAEAYRLNQKYLMLYRTMTFQNSTLIDLYYGGNMRLISNEKIVRDINDLDNFRTNCKDLEENYNHVAQITINLENRIFNASISLKDYTSKNNPQTFITNDVNLIHECANNIQNQVAIYKFNLKMIVEYYKLCHNYPKV